MWIERAICLLALALLAGCGRSPGQPAQVGGAAVNFTLRSPAFAEGATIPVKYTCDGENTSPPLRWDGAPEAKSFVLIVDDPDAPSGTFTHWVLFDIPGAEHELPEGLPSVGALGTPGMNDFMQIDYGGPCPPPGNGPHRYFFTMYALDVVSLLTPRGRPRREIEAAMQGHVIGQTQMMGRYERRS